MNCLLPLVFFLCWLLYDAAQEELQKVLRGLFNILPQNLQWTIFCNFSIIFSINIEYYLQKVNSNLRLVTPGGLEPTDPDIKSVVRYQLCQEVEPDYSYFEILTSVINYCWVGRIRTSEAEASDCGCRSVRYSETSIIYNQVIWYSFLCYYSHSPLTTREPPNIKQNPNDFRSHVCERLIS